MLLSLLSKRSLNDDSRDSYGFTVRPQNIHRYREYANIYKEEEEERLQKWKSFLEQQVSTIAHHFNEDDIRPVVSEVTEQSNDYAETVSGERDDSTDQRNADSEVTAEKTEHVEKVSGERDHSTDQTTADSEVTAEKTEPVEKVSGERDHSTDQRSADSEVTAEKTEPVEKVSGERDDSTDQRTADSEVTAEKTEPVEKVSGERDDSTDQRTVDSVVTAKKTEPVENVSGERDDSTDQRTANSEVTAEKTEPVENVSGERDDSTDQRTVDSVVTAKKTEPVENVSRERDDSTDQRTANSEVTEEKTERVEKVSEQGNDSSEKRHASDTQEEDGPTKEAPITGNAKSIEVQTWAKISPLLNPIEHMLSVRVKKRKQIGAKRIRQMHDDLPSINEARSSGEESEDDHKDSLHDKEIVDGVNASAVDISASDKLSPEPFFPWKEELEFLVRGGVPKDLRGEVWQTFVGVRTRRVERYYQDLLAIEVDARDGKEHNKLLSGDNRMQHKHDSPEKWRKQIEKDLPRTFPGHPALNDRGRNSLRRVLLAYARHNPSVGYCQAMNFFAGILLLMMPEENAFWTLVGIIDDYFEDYFSEEMIESQVDQLVFEDLMRERFPKLVNHLDYLGVEVAWISGPWFLSVFVNMLPWESVLRVWDVLLFEGNRVMLFRTALALMDLYGPAVVTTKDAGDAITLLQNLAGSTFDSSQLVLTACMGFLTITEDRLQELREKHRPAIVAAAEERAKGGRVYKDPKGLATKLYSFKHDPESIVIENKTETVSGDKTGAHGTSDRASDAAKLDEILKGITVDSEVDSLPDLQEQVVWLKAELCRLLEEKRSSMLRADELEAAFMEMVTEDNRRELTARVEQLEQEVAELRQTLADKKEGENAMLQVLMRVEQEQRVTEEARRFAEQDAAAQRYAVHVLEEKYEKAMASIAQMEKRAVMAESMLEATLQYESGQSKALSSPRPAGRLESPTDMPIKRTGLLSFGLGWRDRNKSKRSNDVVPDADTNGPQE